MSHFTARLVIAGPEAIVMPVLGTKTTFALVRPDTPPEPRSTDRIIEVKACSFSISLSPSQRSPLEYQLRRRKHDSCRQEISDRVWSANAVSRIEARASSR